MSYSSLGRVFPEFNKIIPKPIPVVNVYDEKLYRAPPIETFTPTPMSTPTSTQILTPTPTPTNENTDNITEELLVHLNYILNNNLCRDILLKKWGVTEQFDKYDVFLYILFVFFLFIIYERFLKK